MKNSAQKLLLEKKRGEIHVRNRLMILNMTQRNAVLATSLDDRPHASLVAFVMTEDLRELVFASPKDSLKCRNIKGNGRVSLLIDTRRNTEEDYAAAEAITISGAAKILRRGKKRTELASLLAAKHPLLKDFITAPTTALVLVEVEKCVHVGRFREVSEWELA